MRNYDRILLYESVSLTLTTSHRINGILAYLGEKVDDELKEVDSDAIA